MSEMDLALELQLGPKANTISVNNYGKGEGEAVALPKGLGPTCVAIKQHSASDQKAPAVSQGSYKILFQ